MGEQIFEAVWGGLSDGLQPCLIGIPTTGTALAQAAAMFSLEHPKELRIAHRIMREHAKGHGANQKTWVNGAPDFTRHCYIAVDNVITDGATKEEYGALLDASGYRSHEMPWIIVVDRQQGGVAYMKRAGFAAITLFNLLDLVYVLGETETWPQDAVKSVEREIAEHQLVH
jgi:orotate phosphoribosyltransferase